MRKLRPLLSDKEVKEAAEFLKVISNPSRPHLLARLVDGECSVSVLEKECGIRQPSLSQQLSELREAGFVSTRREHKVLFYSLNDPRAAELLKQVRNVLKIGSTRPSRIERTPLNASIGAAVFALTRGPI